jgi:hypothetical protein
VTLRCGFSARHAARFRWLSLPLTAIVGASLKEMQCAPLAMIGISRRYMALVCHRRT